MKTIGIFICVAFLAIFSGSLSAQSNGALDLSTRSVGTSPSHITVSSVAQWMENPLDQDLQVGVTNFYGGTNDCLSITVGPSHLTFYGAGLNEVGNYIPTNYPPVTVRATLRRQYNVSISCPNTGPQGSPLFGICYDADGYLVKNDFASPDAFVQLLTNNPTDLVSGYLWSNFTATAQQAITNAGAVDTAIQTNLIQQMNSIITSGPIYNPNRFPTAILQSDTTNLLAQNPQGHSLVLLNRLLLRDAYASLYPLPLASQCDNSGTATINFSVMAPPQLRIRSYQPTPQYTVLLNSDTSSSGTVDLENLGNGNQSITNTFLEVVKDRFAHVATGDGCDDATKAPGQGSWLQLGPGCTEDTNRISLEWHVSLGRTFDGQAAGQIAFRQPGLSPLAYTPYSLFYNAFLTNILGQAVVVTTNIPVSYTTNVLTGFIVPEGTLYDVYGLLYTNPVTSGNSSVNIFSGFPVTTAYLASYSFDVVSNYAYNTVIPNGGTILFLGYAGTFNFPDWADMLWGPYTNITTNTDLELRQISSYQTFVNITAPDTNTTLLSFYFPGQVGTNQDQYGVFTNITGSPFVTWTIQNPNPGTATNLNIIESRNGNVTTQSLEKVTSGGTVTWTLTQGTGAEQRVETRQVSFSGSPIATNRVELNTVQYAGASTPAYQCQETYYCYPWGWELVQTSLPNGTSPLVTSYDYYTNNDCDSYSYFWGTDGDTAICVGGYGQIRQIIYPDGYWEKRVYNIVDAWYGGWISDERVFKPYFNGPSGGAMSPGDADTSNCQYDDYAIPDDGGVRMQEITEYDQGQITTFKKALTEDYTDTQMTASLNSVDAAGSTGTDSGSGLLEGSLTLDFDDSAPPGLAGHHDHQMTTLQYQVFLYDHGVYDPVANTFTQDSTNHLYSWSGFTNYPDHMETEIDAPIDFWTDDSDFYGGYTSEIPGYTPQIDNYETINDHAMPWYMITSDFIPFYPGKTREHVNIYHGGNLVQSEEYVYMGAGSTDPVTGELSSPQFTLIGKTRYYVDSLGRATNVVWIGAASSQTQTLYTADYRGTSGVDGELLLSETDDMGQQTIYSYDSLKRVTSVVVKGYGGQVNITTNFAYDADERITAKTASAGSLGASEYWAYDSAGRVTNHVDTSGIATSISYSADNLTTTTTSPGGIQIVKQNTLDRIPLSMTGNGAVPEFYEHDTAGGHNRLYEANDGVAGFRERTTHYGYSGSPRWKTQGTDFMGNSDAWVVSPTGGDPANTVTNIRFYASSRLLNEVCYYSPYLTTTHNYDVDGSECMKKAEFGDIPAAPNDERVSGSIKNVINIGGIWYQAATNVTYLVDDVDLDYMAPSSDIVVQSIHLEQLNGFIGSQIAGSIDYDVDGNETITTMTLNRALNLKTVSTSEPNTSSQTAVTVYQNGRVISSSTLSVANPTVYSYDALGRTNLIQDPQGNFTLMAYDPSTGWMTSMTDPAGHLTSYVYYNTNEANSGKVKCQTDANGK